MSTLCITWQFILPPASHKQTMNFLSLASNLTGSDNGLPHFSPIEIGILLFPAVESFLWYFAIHLRTVLQLTLEIVSHTLQLYGLDHECFDIWQS